MFFLVYISVYIIQFGAFVYACVLLCALLSAFVYACMLLCALWSAFVYALMCALVCFLARFWARLCASVRALSALVYAVMCTLLCFLRCFWARLCARLCAFSFSNQSRKDHSCHWASKSYILRRRNIIKVKLNHRRRNKFYRKGTKLRCYESS